MENHNVYEHVVLPQESDFNENITIPALGSLFLNVAGGDALRNHFGPDDLLKMGYAWVVSRFSFEMREVPRMYDRLNVETWIEDYGQLFTTRNFKLYDAAGGIAGLASSQWAIIDVNTRRPAALSSIGDYARLATGEGVDMEKPLKLAGCEVESVSRHRVRYSDLDFNRHTNSMKYVEWMIDTLPIEQFGEHSLKRFDVNFLREARYGQAIEILSQTSPERSFFELRDENAKPICRAQLLWEPRR